MGRPEPCVLFSQTFVHTHLDEYVDEVLFAEPVVITACEFLEQNASSASQAVSLVGATSPPSFALEVFVQSEGETRFRRLCQPFLYSHSSSNVLEVEAVVTNHLVVRGSYRSLSLVIYGNTAEDLGQFNIEFDDSSLTNLVGSADGKLEDLPLPLRAFNRTFEESLSSLNVLSLPVVTLDLSVEVKQLLQQMLKILELPNLGHEVHKVVHTLALAAASFVTFDLESNAINQKHLTSGRNKDFKELNHGISEARKELLELYETLQRKSTNKSSESLTECIFMESDADLASSKQLVEMLSPCFHFNRSSSNFGHGQLPESKNVILGLNVALFLCSTKESCFHFVNCGGMDQLAYLFDHQTQNSITITLLLLGVIEQATRHSVGCEGFLGWWPREDENIPSGTSDGYSYLLKLLLQKPRHDVASLATYILHRLRFYEVISRYESEILSILGGLSATTKGTNAASNKLRGVGSLLKKLLHLVISHGPIEDPSPVAHASRYFILGQTDGLVSYNATSGLIASSNCCFSDWEIDLHLLALLKDRGFLPLSAALLSTTVLHSEAADVVDTSLEIVSSIGSIILSLLFCRSGLVFLLHQPDLTATLIHALKGADAMNKEECVPLRYASVLISKGFTCNPQEVGIIVETHLRVVNAIDRLLSATPQSEEFLWVLWELCGLARSDCGRQALLAMSFFSEVLSVLIEALHSVKESEPVIKNSGASPLNLAILHSAAEIVEVIVTDSTATSLSSWIGHAMELHKALHSSSPGSNRKDAPTRLLEWIDAGLVYHKNGAVGLLRYAAVLASGGDAHLTSTNILVSDLTDVVDNIVGESSNASDINVMENLGSIISMKSFEGVNLRDSSIAQLTTAFRILAFISENPTVAAALYDEGAITVIYVVLVNCSYMLERSSNSYDYLVDEGTECNSTSDLLLERNREQCLVDLLIPSLVLLITLLQRLQEAKEQHKNTKLMTALLRLHREVSPKLAACAADLSSPYPDSALGFEAVCHLSVSALAYWPVYGWSPGLFHTILASVQTTSSLALGPKETCSLLCLLNDLFPEESIWRWKNGMPLLSALRSLAIGTLLGPHKERQVDWYLECGHLEKLFNQLTPHLDRIAQIIQHYAISALVVIQDMLRVFIIRIACQKAEQASKLLRPILSWIHDHSSDLSSLSDTEAYKVYRCLDFLTSLLEHPYAKVLLVGEGFPQILTRVLESCFDATDSDGRQASDCRDSAKYGVALISLCIPVFKSISLLCSSRTFSQYDERHEMHKFDSLSPKDCSIFINQLLKFCQVLPVGKELVSCLTAFRDMGSCTEGCNALLSALLNSSSSTHDELESERGNEKNVNFHFLNESEWRKSPPLLCCWIKLLKSIDSKDHLPSYTLEAANVLSLGTLGFCMGGNSLNMNSVVALKFLFGLPDDTAGIGGFPEDNIKYIQEFSTLLSSRIDNDEDYQTSSDIHISMHQVSESVKSLLLLFQNLTAAVEVDDAILYGGLSFPQNNVQVPSGIQHFGQGLDGKADDSLYSGGFEDKFSWELPETLPGRLLQTALPTRRKLQAADSANRSARGDNSVAEITNPTAFQRGLGPSTASSGTTRRDSFRQRKPNTSRPPSMHVDDYVARERSVDGVSNSNVIAVPRVGSSGGRPPSIHVDEFMARQRERQNPAASGTETATQSKNAAPINGPDNEKVNKSKQLKSDLDDDLQGIDIVFDGEESETDDKLPFPQPDDNLQQLAPVIFEQSSPQSVVEETESDVNGSSQFSHMATPLASNADENAQSEFSSRMSVSRPEMSLTREPSVSSEKKIFEQSDDSKNAVSIKNSSGFDSASGTNSSGFSAPIYSNTPATSVQLSLDSRITPQNFYPKSSAQYAGNIPVAAGSRGMYELKVLPNQPPLPPMPPPPTILPVQSDYLSSVSGSPSLLQSSIPVSDSKFMRTSMPSPSGTTRPPPPLPSTPAPFASSPYNLASLNTSASQPALYNQSGMGKTELPKGSIGPTIDARLPTSAAGLASYPPPPLMQSLVFNRPPSIPVTPYGTSPALHQGENHPPGILQNPSIPQSSMQTIHSLNQLQKLQRPLLPTQHLRPSMQSSQQLEQVVSSQTPVQMQIQSLPMMHQAHISPVNPYYQPQQPEFSAAQQQMQVELAQQQAPPQTGGTSQQQDSASNQSLPSPTKPFDIRTRRSSAASVRFRAFLRPTITMYRTAASRLRALKGRTSRIAPARFASSSTVATTSSSSGGLLSWLTGSQSKSVPSLDFPLPGVALPPSLPDYVEPGKTKITTLPNGLKVASETSASPAASIGLYVDCGSIYESPASFGVSHLLERMAFKSTTNRSHLRIVREVEAIGGNVNAAVSREQIGYTFDALKTYVPEMVELLIDSVRNPAYLDWEVNEQLQKVKEEIAEAAKNPHGLLLEAIHSAGYSGALANPLLAPESAVNMLNSTVLEDFVAEIFTASRMVLAATGVEHEELLSVAEPLLSDLPNIPRAQEPKSVYTGGDYRCQADSGGQTHFALAFELPGGWHNEKEAIILTVLQILMGGGGSFSAGGPGKGMYSRLYLRVLNQYPQVQSFSAFNSIYNHTGLFGIQATTGSDFVPSAIDVAVKELIAVATPGQVEQKELERAKQSTKSAILMNLESRAVASEDIGKQILTYGERKPVEHFLKVVNEITPKDISSVAEKLLSSNLTMASYGNVINVPRYDSISSKFKGK